MARSLGESELGEGERPASGASRYSVAPLGVRLWFRAPPPFPLVCVLEEEDEDDPSRRGTAGRRGGEVFTLAVGLAAAPAPELVPGVIVLGTRYSSTGSSLGDGGSGGIVINVCCSSILAVSSESDAGSGMREPIVPLGLAGGLELAMLDRPPTTDGVKCTDFLMGSKPALKPFVGGGNGERMSDASASSGGAEGSAIAGTSRFECSFGMILISRTSPFTSEPSSSSSPKRGLVGVPYDQLPDRLGRSPRVACVLPQESCRFVGSEEIRWCEGWTGGRELVAPIVPVMDPASSSSSSLGSSTTYDDTTCPFPFPVDP